MFCTQLTIIYELCIIEYTKCLKIYIINFNN